MVFASNPPSSRGRAIHTVFERLRRHNRKVSLSKAKIVDTRADSISLTSDRGSAKQYQRGISDERAYLCLGNIKHIRDFVQSICRLKAPADLAATLVLAASGSLVTTGSQVHFHDVDADWL